MSETRIPQHLGVIGLRAGLRYAKLTNVAVSGNGLFFPIACTVMILLPETCYGECRRTPIVANVGETHVSQSFIITNGDSCGVTYKTHDNMEIIKVSIAEKPSHGIAGANQDIVDHGYAYKPFVGFVGKDNFVVAIDFKGAVLYHQENFHWTMNIDVSVDVK